jgi:hypothetical protein
LRRPAALCFAGAITLLGIAAMAPATAAGNAQPAPVRIEARSADLLAVGVVQDDRMSIHLSRLLDNAPVRDVDVTVLLRGVAHPTTAEADGGFTLQTPDLRLPGTAGVEFQIAGGAAHETLKGALQVAAGAGVADDKNSARQLWWWVLNFAVCIGFLWLISRRRKSAQE